ncbi:hypothetical protein FAM15333_001740 [Propionibacterium freudenreichii]|uniref:hypothetical protein n=1 Tax=Propionibacterium freudenreichii TaxID=1744 RepID=UPI00254EB079|nr:hypothetical protein [Propionibacterium freudenreichii]MDK9646455.1 hypothetical protein [Propionibacterium freudenreichii]MDK9666965.1 hypothetical protein [Propionibacterium freudenreichii]
MPTFDDPRADAAEASAALRSLAHATRAMPEPADTYPVIGELLAGVRSLRQVLYQLGNAHLGNRERAYDDAGNHTAGSMAAALAADELHQAGVLLAAVEQHLDAASQHSGRIAWHPVQAAEEAEAVGAEPVRRWVSVVFLQGEEADAVLDIIDRHGTDAAIEHLANFDYGEETTQVALENGYVYDEPPRGLLDRVAAKDAHTLTYSPFLGHVTLLREHDARPDPALSDINHPATTGRALARPSRGGVGAAADWFSRPASSSVQGRGLSL